jgi:ABC-type amino acid transport substrate-binding protein
MLNKFWSKKPFRILVQILVPLFLLLTVWKLCTNSEGPSKKKYVIARGTNLSPLKFEGKEPNVMAFESDLLSAVAHSQKLRINLVTANDSNLFVPLDQEFYDAILAVVEPNSMMHTRYYMSEPIFYGGPVLIVRETSNVTSLKELQGRGIAIEAGSPLIFRLSQDDLLLVSYQNMISALEDLTHGVIDGVIMEANLAYTYTSGFYKNKLKVATPPLTDVGIRLIARDTREGEYLVEHFNKGLAALESSGAYAELVKKWELIEP